MFCATFIRRHRLRLPNVIFTANYSRRSDKSTSSYRMVKSSEESLDDVDNTVFETNSNWELLTPKGFRFYLPGSIGPGWLDANTTVSTKSQFVDFQYNNESLQSLSSGSSISKRINKYNIETTLQCVAQDCPLLLRKGVEELFPGCLDVCLPQLTIVTISQKTHSKTKWSREEETEKLVKCFVLAASKICAKLKIVGYWADFINPFSGQPYFSQTKNNKLYKTDERFRCLGFTIEQKENCKVIMSDYNMKNLIGSLYTTAPPNTEFFKNLLYDFDENE